MRGVATRAASAPLSELNAGLIAETGAAGITGDAVETSLINQD